MSLWKKIAKNEIRLKTSRFRKNRKIFFIFTYSICLYWGIILGPIFLDAIIPEIVKELSIQFESLFVQIIEFIFASFFLMAVMYPLFVLFRKSEIEKKDIILASPIKPADIIFGEFIGQIPFYILIILVIGPFGIVLLLQINPEMNLLHYLIFYLSFFTLYILGSLIGVLISNWIEKKFFEKVNLKKSANLILILISIAIIIIYYSFHFLFNFLRDHPEIKSLFLFYPSFWYSNIILYFVNFSFIESYLLNIWVSFLLGILIPLTFSYFFYKKAGIFYELKYSIERNPKMVKNGNKFYIFFQSITNRNYKNLVVIQFKEFLRKKENIIKLIFLLGTTSVLGVFMRLSVKSEIFSLILEPLSIPILFQINYDKNVITIILSWMGGLIFGLFMGMHDFIGSKELLFTYKRSPKGTRAIYYSYLYELLYILIFYDIILTIFFSILFQLDLFIALIFFLSYFLSSEIILIQSTGVQSIRPLFEERRRNLIFNNYLIFLFQIISFLITLFLIIPFFPVTIGPYIGLILIILIDLGLSGIIAIFIFYLAIVRLNKIE
ncbi:MAG: hypothetical protein ACFFEY_10935 [Candidatus Thorarchaeota archaeon]